MFDFEREIKNWRRELTRAGIRSSSVLDELEGHLRNETASLTASGKPGPEAFRLAASRMGNAYELHAEFKKLKVRPIWPVTIGTTFWGVSVALLAFAVISLFVTRESYLRIHHEPIDPLDLAGMFALFSGFTAEFLAGAFAISYFSYERFHALTSRREQSLEQAVTRFNLIAAGLVGITFIVGICSNLQNEGYLYHPKFREAGHLCSLVWLFSFAWRVIMLLCSAGNIVLGIDWFVAGFISKEGTGAFFSWRFWPVHAFIAIHFLVIILGMTTLKQETLAKS
jgi:hypothetical protein